jgi:hypothetical protein
MHRGRTGGRGCIDRSQQCERFFYARSHGGAALIFHKGA